MRQDKAAARGLMAPLMRFAARVALVGVVVSCGDTTVDLPHPDRGLLAHWTLDEAVAGGPIHDAAGWGLPEGTTSSPPPTPSSDVPPVHFPDSHSLSFNGVDQWVSLQNPGILNMGGVITLAAWVRPAAIEDGAHGGHTVVTHGYRDNPKFDLGLRLIRTKYEFAYWDGVNHSAEAPILATDLNRWVHLCGTFDGNAYKIYVDGVLADSKADATSPPANADTFWSIGAKIPMPDLLDRPMDGKIDDVRIYGRALSADEVRALFRK